MFGTLLNKLQNYIQIKRVKTINTDSAKHLSIAASSTVARPKALLCHACSLGSFQNSRPLIHYHSLPTFFYIYETHCKVYTNKPRALLMQQALYNEPKRARLLWRMGCLYKPWGGFQFTNTSSPSHRSPWICTCSNHPSPVLNRQCTQVHLTNTGQPLWHSHNVSSALFVDKGIDYQILQRI